MMRFVIPSPLCPTSLGALYLRKTEAKETATGFQRFLCRNVAIEPARELAIGNFYCNVYSMRARRARRRKSVLIVDDVEDNRRIYAMFLRFDGFDVTTAVDGHDALEQARAALPDLVVMDLAIPGIDGWEVTRTLKRDGRTRSIPVIAVTGHALAGAEARAKEAGCDAFLTKPCLPDTLSREIRRILKLRPRRGTPR
jgi:two-component system, cell cycle response regulator DivK